MNEQHSARPTDSRSECSRWRKKPIVIEAWKVCPPDGHAPPPTWLMEAVIGGTITFDSAVPCAMINTLEGVMRADPGDWIIKGVKGELYPCKNDIFEATYDPA